MKNPTQKLKYLTLVALAASAVSANAQLLSPVTQAEVYTSNGGDYGTNSQPAANLTAVGLTDWETFTESDGSPNVDDELNGGAGLGAPTAFFTDSSAGYLGAGAGYNNQSNFSYTNGTNGTGVATGLTNEGVYSVEGSYTNTNFGFNVSADLAAGVDTVTLYLDGFRDTYGVTVGYQNLGDTFSGSFNVQSGSNFSDVETLTFDLSSEQIVTFTVNSHSGQNGGYIGLEAAALTDGGEAPVPEPSTYALLLLGGAALFVTVRRVGRQV